MKIEKSSPFGNVEIIVSVLLKLLFSAFSILGFFKDINSFLYEKYISVISVPVELDPIAEPEPIIYFTEDGFQNVSLDEIKYEDFDLVSFIDIWTLDEHEKNAVDCLLLLKKNIEDMKLVDEKGRNFSFLKEIDRLSAEYEKILEIRLIFNSRNYLQYLKKNGAFIENLQKFRKKFHDHVLYDSIIYSEKIKEWNKNRVWKKLCGDFSTEEIAFRIWNDWTADLYTSNENRFGFLSKSYYHSDKLVVLFNEILLKMIPQVNDDDFIDEQVIFPVEPFFSLFRIFSFVIALLIILAVTLMTKKISVKSHDLLFVCISLLVVVTGIVLFLFGFKFDVTGCFIFVALNTFCVLYLRARNRKFFLKINRENLLQYMGSAAAEKILLSQNDYCFDAKEQVCSVLATEIENFSTFIGSLSKVNEKIVVLVEYFETISSAIHKSEGLVDKYDRGSSISIFGVPFGYKNHAYRACVAAINIKKAESDFNKKHMIEENLKEDLNTRIGINSGSMIVGNLGPKFKSNYSVIGENSDIAKKMVQINRIYGTSILCTEETWSSVDFGERKGEISAKKFDKIKINGKDNPVQFYNIVGFTKDLTTQQAEDIKLFNEAIELYWKRKFIDAGKMFLKANEIFPEDKAALVFAERCKKYLTVPVSDDWDGVLDLNNYFSN